MPFDFCSDFRRIVSVSRRLSVGIVSLRCLVGSGEVLNESCGDDVEDELEFEVQKTILREQQERTFLFCTEFPVHSWSDVAI